MESYFESNKKKDCNGCSVCMLKCPKKAITMNQDSEGFIYPVIDREKCINCNLCKKICPNKEQNKNDNVHTFIAINKSNEELKNSSSGGCFLPIAEYILNKKGVVFGVTYDKSLKAVHEFTETKDDLIKFQGSKYVRSDLNNSYQKIKEFLNDDRFVLFSGTPCQCAGLRVYLGKEYSKLYTCEIICHANPSPKVFEYYKKYLETKHKKKIKDIQFRTKKTGWHNQMPRIIFNDDTFIDENSYFNAFVNEMINRPSCSNCKFCSSNRLSDFTIGDAWGIDKIDPSIIDDDKGISLFCINTYRGMELKHYFESKMFLKEVNTDEAFKYNHYKNVPMHRNRNKFFKGISEGVVNERNILEYINKYNKLSLFSRLLNKVKCFIKKLNRRCNYGRSDKN